MDNENDLFATPAQEEQPQAPAPKRRGRPRKNPVAAEKSESEKSVDTASAPLVSSNVEQSSANQPDPTAVYAPGVPAAVPSAEPIDALDEPPVQTEVATVPQPSFREPKEVSGNSNNSNNNNPNRHNNNNNKQGNGDNGNRRDRFRKNKNNRNHRNNNNNDRQDFAEEELPPVDPNAPTLNITDLQNKSIVELAAMGAELGIRDRRIGKIHSDLRNTPGKCGKMRSIIWQRLFGSSSGWIRISAFSGIQLSAVIRRYLSQPVSNQTVGS